MFVLTVEGTGFRSKSLWTTHKVLGLFENKEKAIEHIKPMLVNDEGDGDIDLEEDAVILTNLTTMTAERISEV